MQNASATPLVPKCIKVYGKTDSPSHLIYQLCKHFPDEFIASTASSKSFFNTAWCSFCKLWSYLSKKHHKTEWASGRGYLVINVSLPRVLVFSIIRISSPVPLPCPNLVTSGSKKKTNPTIMTTASCQTQGFKTVVNKSAGDISDKFSVILHVKHRQE